MLFKTTAEFRIVDINTNILNLQDYIVDAEQQYILKVLGAPQLAALQDDFDSNAIASGSPVAKLLEKVQTALRNLTMYIAMPKINLRFSDLGVKKTLSDSYENATGGEVYFARIQYLIDGFRGLDALYSFLEENIVDYPDYSGDIAYKKFKEYFINTADIFSKHVTAVSNRYLFSMMLSQMDTVEKLRIKGAIGAEFFEELKASFSAGTETDEERALMFGDDDNTITGLAKPISLFTYADCLMDPTIREMIRICNAATADDLSNKGTGTTDYKKEYFDLAELKRDEANAFLQGIITYLNATASSSVFATYFNSDKYKDPDITTNPKLSDYNNNSSKSTFGFL